MKKYIDNLEKQFINYILDKDFSLVKSNLLLKKISNIHIFFFSFGCTYEKKRKIYNTSSNFNIKYQNIDLFFEDCIEKDVFLFYDSETKKIDLISGFLLYYLQILYGEDNYPDGIYNYFTKEQVEETPEIVLEYLQREYYEKGFLDLEEKYGTIERADKTINDEILSNGFVKKHNINWADFDNHCIRSILFAHFNNNPNILELVEICNKTMLEEKLKNPNNPRIDLYNFILKKLGFKTI